MRGADQHPAHNAIVLGIGSMNSAPCCHLARRGQQVFGLERFDIPDSMGSSHGVSRIIRLAYCEDPRCAPLLRCAYRLCRELEIRFREALVFLTG
ncbi:MAG: hypothetical protein M3R02_03625 [Chloroflexota bacterium]|nr:hypothetical protein [Chloroflexota bacterium]